MAMAGQKLWKSGVQCGITTGSKNKKPPGRTLAAFCSKPTLWGWSMQSGCFAVHRNRDVNHHISMQSNSDGAVANGLDGA
jgi:hypothetical protein